MKFTLSWLKDHLETLAPLDEILTALTDLGLEVEGVEDPGDALGSFTICRVIEAVKHPNADKLRLCRVEAWPNGPDQPSQEVQVVCGAPNARTGLVGVFAAPGMHIPGTGVDLKPGVIRGVESNGMLDGRALYRLCGAERPGDRYCRHPEPARCAGHRRDRPRSGSAGAGRADHDRGRSGSGLF
jgi:tRNA-binding EMAP/Myf-like protein